MVEVEGRQSMKLKVKEFRDRRGKHSEWAVPDGLKTKALTRRSDGEDVRCTGVEASR